MCYNLPVDRSKGEIILENKVVFITGAAKNTGLAIAEKFASEGFSVAVSSRSKESAEKTAKYITEKYGVKSRGYALDLTSVEDIKQVFSEIKKDFGRLDTFVPNSADLGVGQDILSVTEKNYDDLMNVNLKGTYFCCQQAGLLMKETGGSIVIINSVHALECIYGRSLYSVSKGGLHTLAKTIAIELAPYGIRANCIMAGAIKTDRWDGFTEAEVAARRANWPLGIESTGEDIANGVYYLGTDLSKTVTGSDVTIDSGIAASLLQFSSNHPLKNGTLIKENEK